MCKKNKSKKKAVVFYNLICFDLSLSPLYLTVEKPTIFQLKSIPLQRVITLSLCFQKEATKHVGRGNKSPDHIIIF